MDPDPTLERPVVRLADVFDPLGRLILTILGVVVVVMGLVYAARTFNAVYKALVAPKQFATTFEQWKEVLGGDALDLKILDQTYPTATILSVLIVGAGFLVLAWISIGILTAGGRLISWTTSERDAIRSILQQVSGDRTRKTP